MKGSAFKYNTPILIVCFNRPQYVEKQLAILRELKPQIIYLAADGSRNGVVQDKLKVEMVREEYIRGINWDCTVKTKFSDSNLGCFEGPHSALTWFFKHEKEGVILEDDILPGLDFFRFAQEMLRNFRYNKNIISISGCNLGYTGNKNEYFLCKIMNMWGWATWRDRFESVDFSMQGWRIKNKKRLFLYNRLRNNLFDLDVNWWKHWENIFNKTINKEVITWDYQFIYNQIENKKLTVYPGVNLIKNNGFDEDATHTKNANTQIEELTIGSVQFPLKANKRIKNNANFYENYLKPIWANYNRPNLNYYLGKLISKKR